MSASEAHQQASLATALAPTGVMVSAAAAITLRAVAADR